MEQKFKVWDKKEKRWITDDVLLGSKGEIYLDGLQITKLNPEDVDVLFSTGFFDSNLKEVYKGDIIFQHPTKRKSIVKWDKENGCWSLGSLDCSFSTGYMLRNYCEIIGNRFENPELLKED